MTPETYMALLLDRQAAYETEHATRSPWFRPLLEWFVRPGDEDLFTPPTPAPQPKRETQPRTYRPASHWAARLARVEAEMEGLESPLLTDRAAAGGVGLGVHGSARVQAREDSRLARYAELARKANGLRGRMESAQRREVGRG